MCEYRWTNLRATQPQGDFGPSRLSDERETGMSCPNISSLMQSQLIDAHGGKVDRQQNAVVSGIVLLQEPGKRAIKYYCYFERAIKHKTPNVKSLLNQFQS